jgi:curli biogenesis system outer membrane secretion channel CsgG
MYAHTNIGKTQFRACTVTLVALLASGLACAAPSTYTGTLLKVAATASTISPTTQTRIAIVTTTAKTTACSAASNYSFDLANASLTSSYEAILFTALTANVQVIISGSGVCDAYGTEEVAAIWLL